MKMVKKIAKSVIPSIFIRYIKNIKFSKYDMQFNGLNNKQLFTKVYTEGHWGKSTSSEQPFYSGSGSHKPEAVDLYINALSEFLQSFKTKPSVSDLGCGDFAIGSRLREFCSEYTACDIVDDLINHNKKAFSNQNVTFCIIDIVNDPLPQADICIVREVLQHLKNDDIAVFLHKAKTSYKYLIVSESIPTGEFKANLEKPIGPSTRLRYHSGVVLTSSPFNLNPITEIPLCNAPNPRGIIQTTVYELSQYQ